MTTFGSSAACQSPGPNVHYCIMGELRRKKYYDYLLGLIKDEGVAKHVSIQTNVSELHRRAALAEADLYVQPSHEEGFCLAYVEAAIVTPRVIGTDTGAIRAVSANEPGMEVVAPGDSKALEAATRRLLDTSLSGDEITTRRQSLCERSPGAPISSGT